MLRYVKNGMLLLSVAYIVIGMLLLIMPETSLLWICNIFGVVVLVTGIVCLIQYARIRGTGFTAPFMLVGGVITAGLGIFTLAKPQVVTSFLPVVFGIFIVVDGLSRIGTAIDLAKRKGRNGGCCCCSASYPLPWAYCWCCTRLMRRSAPSCSAASC